MKPFVANMLFLSPVEAGKQLGVDYLVQGVVQSVQQQLLITVSLINSHTEQVIWADRYLLSAPIPAGYPERV